MTEQDINEMASECGLIATVHIEAFAKLVEAHTLLRIEPIKLELYQEGFGAGNRLAVDGFCKQLRQLHDAYSCASDPSTLRTRGEA